MVQMIVRLGEVVADEVDELVLLQESHQAIFSKGFGMREQRAQIARNPTELAVLQAGDRLVVCFICEFICRPPPIEYSIMQSAVQLCISRREDVCAMPKEQMKVARLYHLDVLQALTYQAAEAPLEAEKPLLSLLQSKSREQKTAPQLCPESLHQAKAYAHLALLDYEAHDDVVVALPNACAALRAGWPALLQEIAHCCDSDQRVGHGKPIMRERRMQLELTHVSREVTPPELGELLTVGLSIAHVLHSRCISTWHLEHASVRALHKDFNRAVGPSEFVYQLRLLGDPIHTHKLVANLEVLITGVGELKRHFSDGHLQGHSDNRAHPNNLFGKVVAELGCRGGLEDGDGLCGVA